MELIPRPFCCQSRTSGGRVRGLGLEGVIAKRKDSLYEPGERSDDWQKVKLDQQQEFVIGGYRPGLNRKSKLDSAR